MRCVYTGWEVAFRSQRKLLDRGLLAEVAKAYRDAGVQPETRARYE